MQKSVEEKPGGITETVGHYYNGMEQRIRKVVDQNTTKYVYTGTTVLFTADDNNDKITENVVAPSGKIVASGRFDSYFNGNMFFFHQDIRNSTTAIINHEATAMKYYEYDEKGNAEEKGNDSFINENTFTGAISEGDGIYYMNARFYDSNTGRFLSQDSYSGNAYEPWSQHLYSYCGNNPVNMVDPTGHNGIPAGVPSDVYYEHREYFDEEVQQKIKVISQILESEICGDDTQATLEYILSTKNYDAITLNYSIENVNEDNVLSYYNEMVGEAEKRANITGGAVGTLGALITSLLMPPALPAYLQYGIPVITGVAAASDAGNAAYNRITDRDGKLLTGTYTKFDIFISYRTGSSGYVIGRISGMVGPGTQSQNPLNYVLEDHVNSVIH